MSDSSTSFMDDSSHSALVSKLSSAICVNEQLASILPYLLTLTQKVTCPDNVLTEGTITELNVQRAAAAEMLVENTALKSRVASLSSSLAAQAAEHSSSVASLTSKTSLEVAAAQEAAQNERRARLLAEASEQQFKITVTAVEARADKLSASVEEEGRLRAAAVDGLQQSEKALLQRTKERDEARDEARELSGACAVAQAEVVKLKHSVSQLSADKVDMIVDLKSKAEALAQKDFEIQDLKSELGAALQRISQLSADANAAALVVLDLERRASESSSLASTLESRLSAASDDLSSSRSALAQARDALVVGQRASAERCVDLSQRLTALGGENALLQGAVARGAGEAAAMKEELRAMKTKLEAGGAEARTIAVARDEAIVELATCHRRLATMEADISRLTKEKEEGFSRAKKAEEEVERATAASRKAVEERGGFEELYREGEIKVCDMAAEVANCKEQLRKVLSEKKAMKLKVEEAEVTMQEMKREIDDAYEDNRKLNVDVADFKSQMSKQEDLAFKLKEIEAIVSALERDKAEANREIERMKSAADLWNCKLDDANNMLEITRKREEHERSEKVLLEDRIEELKAEAKKMKKVYDEGREALNQATKTMREIEGRSLEGVLEREKEIERLSRRNKVLGEAIGRLTGEQNSAEEAAAAAASAAVLSRPRTAANVSATPPPRPVGAGETVGKKMAAWNWVSPDAEEANMQPELTHRLVEEDGDEVSGNSTAFAKWTSPPLPEVLGGVDGNISKQYPEKLRLAVALKRDGAPKDTVSGRILYEDENDRSKTTRGEKKTGGDKKCESKQGVTGAGASGQQQRRPKLSEISAAQAAALYK